MSLLVTDWKTALKRLSNQFILIAGSLPLAWMALPKEWQTVIAEWNGGVLALIASGLAVAAFISSNIRQKKLQPALEKAYARVLDEESSSDS